MEVIVPQERNRRKRGWARVDRDLSRLANRCGRVRQSSVSIPSAGTTGMKYAQPFSSKSNAATLVQLPTVDRWRWQSGANGQWACTHIVMSFMFASPNSLKSRRPCDIISPTLPKNTKNGVGRPVFLSLLGLWRHILRRLGHCCRLRRRVNRSSFGWFASGGGAGFAPSCRAVAPPCRQGTRCAPCDGKAERWQRAANPWGRFESGHPRHLRILLLSTRFPPHVLWGRFDERRAYVE